MRFFDSPSRLSFFFAIVCLSTITKIFASTDSRSGDGTITLKWAPSIVSKTDENKSVKLLSFEGGVYDGSENSLPFYSQLMPNPFPGLGVSVKLIPIAVSALDPQGAEIPSDLGTEFELKYAPGIQAKKPYVSVAVLPVRKNPVTGALEKLDAFKLELSQSGGALKPGGNNSRVYASSSVLQSGTWYKMDVSTTGIHKITYQILQDMGLTPSQVDPSQLRIFGNGGGMLPYNNAIYRHDDLVENAILVYDTGTPGVFDQNDYVLFYGKGPHVFNYDKNDNRFHHQLHLFSLVNSYFLTPDLNTGTPPKRIQNQASSPLTTTHITNVFDDYAVHEMENTNFIKSGRQWYGEQFDTDLTQSFFFNFPNLETTQPAYIYSNVIAHSFSASYFRTYYNNQLLFQQDIPAVGSSYTSDYAAEKSASATFNANSGNIEIVLTYIPTTSTSIGYLNYIELNVRRRLKMSGDQMMFRDLSNAGTGNVTKFQFDNAGQSVTIWDITDPTAAKKQLFSSGSDFVVTTDSLREFIAFNGNTYLSPVPAGQIMNQNLHASLPADLVIVAPSQFVGEANRLASFRRSHDNLRVVVVTPDQIYNEFSSGVRDITAIRDYVRMLYDKAGVPADAPKYLLLFGDGSYDNRSDSPSNTNFLPTYQSLNSISLIGSYVSDDYYGFLDPDEGEWYPGNLIDIGIGRFPVKSLEEATYVVNKTIDYSSPGSVTGSAVCNAGNTSSFGDWRNQLCFIADDEDNDLHLDQSNSLANYVKNNYPVYNLDKIFLDAYNQVATPGGQRYPDVNDAINKRMEKGALVINYTGHGGETGWTAERILDIAMIQSWTNVRKCPLFITATCEFSRFDDPGRTSAGELVLINSEAGGIALMTTTRLVYAAQNGVLNQVMMEYLFEPVNGQMPRLGDIYLETKNNNNVVSSGINSRNFTLLGDPSLQLGYPKHNIVTKTINGSPVIANQDTLSALEKVTITGEVQQNGQVLTSFNGVVYPTVLDKQVVVSTLSNDASSPLRNYTIQKNALYRGKASVNNGEFTYTFIVPKDIAYQIGQGRLSYYAHDGIEDANGFYDSLLIGGSSTTVVTDLEGPSIQLYMNDEKFVFGGTTDESPKIYALVVDSNGVNTVGNGIGHDIVAQLDGESDKIFVLNDFYESNLDSYQSGKVIYPLNDLENGRHTLEFKIWDIYNNSSTAYTEFVVAESAEIALKHVLNYPNPFTTRTSFWFEHNRPCNTLDVQVQIFTVSGKLIKTIDRTVTCEGYRVDDIEWDGKDDYGDAIGQGVYVYRLKIRDMDGQSAEKYEKLVLLK